MRLILFETQGVENEQNPVAINNNPNNNAQAESVNLRSAEGTDDAQDSPVYLRTAEGPGLTKSEDSHLPLVAPSGSSSENLRPAEGSELKSKDSHLSSITPSGSSQGGKALKRSGGLSSPSSELSTPP